VFDDLAAGESVTITAAYNVTDGDAIVANTATITINGANDAPTAADDSGNVVVGVQFASNVIDGNMGGQDTDPDTSDTLSVTAFATTGGAAGTIGDENGLPGQYGTLVLNSNGSLTYNADLQAGLDLVDGDAPVTDNFTYTISDSNGGTETATLSFSVTAAPPGNAAPVVSPIAITVTEDDTPFSTNLMVGQSDPNADPLSIMSDATFSAVDNGGARYPSSDATISLADNILTIDPTMLNELDDGESVDFTVTYNISDGQLSTQNTAIITVTGVNDAPVVAAITDAKTEEDAAFTIDLVGNQSDPDGELLSVSGIPTVTAVDANGTAFALPDNTASVTGDILTINPTLLNALGDGESVDILLTYDVSDGTVATQNTATIKISGINDAPVVAAITDTKTEDDASFVTDLTAGQNDPDGDTLSVTGTPTITATDGNGDFTLHNGTVSIDGNNLTIDPTLLNALDDGESVDILVTYDVSDGTTTTQNTAIITVTGVNDAPSADGNTISIAEDGLHNFTAAEFNFDDDDKNDTLAHITITSLPTAGSFTLNNADVSENQIIPADEIAGLVFTPDAGASAAAYASFGFTVNDGTADSVAAYTMTINVTEENDAPITVAITDTKTEDDAAFTTDLTLGQTDPEDDTLSVSDTPAISAAFANGDTVTLPANTVSVNGNILTVDPTLLNALGDGESVNITVTYDVSDGTATSPNTATITVTGLNDAPTSRGGNLELQGEQPINLSLDNFAFADVDKDALDKVTIVTAPQNGKLYLNDVELGDGAEIPAASINDLVYQPGAGASGSNYDAFIFSVNDGTDDSQNYTMSVGVNAAPTASDTPISLAEDTPFSGQLVATDMESGPLTYRVTRPPQHGTVALIGNGPNYIYTPDAHYYGSDSFTFEASDGALADTGNVTIDVTPENDRPVQRFLIPDITLMDGQAAKIFVAQAFAEIDALNPSLAGFNRSIDKLFSDGQFRNNTQLRNVPPSGQLTYSVSGLPDGMWLDNRNRICGVSTELGTFDVIVTATDGEGKSRNMTFKLSIAMPVIDRITDFQMGDTAKGEHETPKETPTEFSDHNMKPVLKIKPRKEGIVPDRFTAEAPPALAPDAAIGGSANATGLSGSSWMDTRVSTQQDVSGNIRVLDMEIKGEEIAVQIYDQAVDRAQRFKGEMADGKNLPDWITVDPLTGLTTAEPPSNADAVEINVIAEDGSGNQRAINLIIDPKELMADNRPDAESTARQAREIVRSDTDVNVLGNGRVEFAEGLTASEGAMRLMRMVADTALVKIEIADSEKENDTRYEVRQTNGTAVPDWVQVNTQTGELTIEAPENVSGIELLLVATGNGEQRSIELDVNLDEMLDRGAADNTEPSTDNSGNASERDETGQFVPLDAQIEDALAGNNYGRDIQHALDGHA
jgi:VCBS repeat-containing protein